MILSDQKIKNLIKNYKLQHREDVLDFINENPESLGIEELSRISELVNNSRVDTAAYYTDKLILNALESYLPDINKKEIRVLEPSVGIGNFIQIIIDKYRDAEKLIIEVNDIDWKSIELTKALNQYRDIPENVELVYHNVDFLSPLFFYSGEHYDVIIGNPPFLKLTKKNGLTDYAISFNDFTTNNLAGFFMQKAVSISDYTFLILPKYFLSNSDFYETRKRINNYAINNILDFGEKGFKGVLIETIAILIDVKKEPNLTESYSLTKNIHNLQKQSVLTSDEYPSWLIYRNEFFDKIATKMDFGIFSVFRDRQLTNKILKDNGEVRVIKSRNISRDGTEFISIENYDSYVDKDILNKVAVGKYYERNDVYLSPNMTYYPRVIKKEKNTIVNGSVAILENKTEQEVTADHLKFLSSLIFEEFYSIARNYSTRSLNIDANSVFFFGLYND